MRVNVRKAFIILWLTLILAGCSSPEAQRVREGGPGADIGNREPTVQPKPSKFIAVTPGPFTIGQDKLPPPPDARTK